MVIDKHIKNARKIASILDNRYEFFGIKFGLDPLLDIIPGLGSIVGAITSCYIFWIATKLKIPLIVYLKMTINILLDLVIGEIPLVGIFFDIFYKSNIKNLALLEKYIKPNKPKVVEAEIVK